MKKLFISLFSLMVVALSVSGCFRPEGMSDDADADLLTGYWEIVHLEEEYLNYEIYADGTSGQVYQDYFSEDISVNDGNESYAVLQFSPAYITLIATDCPDDVEILMQPLSYTRSGDKLYGIAFEGDFCKYTQIKSLDEDRLVLFMEDIGTDYYEGVDPVQENPAIGFYEEWRSTMTYRRIEQ